MPSTSYCVRKLIDSEVFAKCYAVDLTFDVNRAWHGT